MPTIPRGFDAAPSENLCAFVTSDGQRTDLFYKNGNLARVEQPGAAAQDMAYDETTGLLTTVRDELANDAIAAGVRANDQEAPTKIGYDGLARAVSVTMTAPTPGANRSVNSRE